MHSTWIEINCSALRHNIAAVQKVAGEARIIAVVKGNAYGCGDVECSRVWESAGAAMLAVTRVEEALPLRNAGITAPILLLAPALPDEYEEALRHDLTFSVTSFEMSQAISALAQKLGVTARLHLKINTGMNRFGCLPERAAEFAGRSRSLPNVQLEGAFTHFANATDSNTALTEEQFKAFEDATYGLKGVAFHVANSAATVRFPKMRLDFVRPGTLLYGQFPAPLVAEAAKPLGLTLKDPFAAKTRVVEIQQLKKGEKFGYGSEWTAPRDATLAIVAMGWADGLMMEPHARPETPLDAIKAGLTRAARLQKNPNAGRSVTIGGSKANIVGRVAMQTCAIDVTDLPSIRVGDEVVVPVRRLAAGQMLPRVYVD